LLSQKATKILLIFATTYNMCEKAFSALTNMDKIQIQIYHGLWLRVCL